MKPGQALVVDAPAANLIIDYAHHLLTEIMLVVLVVLSSSEALSSAGDFRSYASQLAKSYTGIVSEGDTLVLGALIVMFEKNISLLTEKRRILKKDFKPAGAQAAPIPPAHHYQHNFMNFVGPSAHTRCPTAPQMPPSVNWLNWQVPFNSQDASSNPHLVDWCRNYGAHKCFKGDACPRAASHGISAQDWVCGIRKK